MRVEVPAVATDPRGMALRAGLKLSALITLSLLVLQGCGPRARLKAVPDDLESKAYVPGLDPGIRYFPRDTEHI